MNASIVIATCGEQRWSDLAFARAFPSARDQRGLDGSLPEIVIEHHPDLSVSAARNAAAAAASGDFLVFLDADDELEPDYVLAMQSAFLHGAITTDWAPLLVPVVRYFPAARAGIPNRGRWPEVNECVVGTGIRRSCFDELGGFREWPLYEDWDLWLRANKAGAQLVYVEEAVYRAYVNPDGGRNFSPAARATYDQIWADYVA